MCGTVGLHRLRQDEQRRRFGDTYQTGLDLVFAAEDGSPIPPWTVTFEFSKLAAEAGLRHIRFHDLRHGAASLLLSSGADLGVIKEIMGHASVSVTIDTYSRLIGPAGRQVAEAASALVPRQNRDPNDLGDKGVTRQSAGQP